jgi:flagellar basal body-associated protein FliL
MTQPPQGGPGPVGGHPEPDPVPSPEPEPPLPIPPPDPVPPPEPPHTDPGEFIDGGPTAPRLEWPPLGAYPGEPGHPAGTPADPTVPPAAADPWHAQHEKPGEWQYQPPEHLAWQHSATLVGPAATPSAEPVWAAAGPPPPAEPIWAGTPAPPRKRGGLWVSLALAVILLLCGGGAVSAYFLVSNADSGKGAPDPATAVNRFLSAVYTEPDADVADGLVCRQARDKGKLTARINEIKNYVNVYDGPTFRWSTPSVGTQTDKRAVVTVQLTLSTADEKQAQQSLTFTTIHKTGWLVCDVAG